MRLVLLVLLLLHIIANAYFIANRPSLQYFIANNCHPTPLASNSSHSAIWEYAYFQIVYLMHGPTDTFKLVYSK